MMFCSLNPIPCNMRTPITIQPIRIKTSIKEVIRVNVGVVLMGRWRVDRSAPTRNSTRRLIRCEYGVMKMTSPYIPMNIKMNARPKTNDIKPSRRNMPILTALIRVSWLVAWLGWRFPTSISHL
jgi:hypothetical protein